MPQDKEDDFLFPFWLKASTDIWSHIAQAIPASENEEKKSPSETNNRFLEQWEKNLQLMKSFSHAMSEPASAASAINALNTLPEIILRMAKSGYEAGFKTQQHILEKAGKIGKRAEAYNFDNLDQEVFKALTDIYEKELRQYFQIPQLGFSRYYQERFNEFLDKQNLFESTLAEFLSIIYLPLEKSFKVLQEKLQAMAKEGIMPKEAKENYALWIKILEGHYMNLFKSKEYTEALHKTLEKMEDFIVAKNNFLQDFLQFFPVTTTKEMDEFYKEFHQLKRRVK